MNPTGACDQVAVGPPAYRRAKLQDLVTVTVLKLQSRDTRPLSTAQLLNEVEEEIRGWAIAKPILAARRLRSDGTRGVRLGQVIEIHDGLIDGTHGACFHDRSRESHIVARAHHTLGHDRNLWPDVLAGD